MDKITIVSTGNGDAAGMNKITGDIAKMAAQVPALFETLSGMRMTELSGKVRAFGDKSAKPDVLPREQTESKHMKDGAVPRLLMSQLTRNA